MELVRALGEPFQVGVIVSNLQECLDFYWRILGIEPWSIYTFPLGSIDNPTIWGKQKDYAMKLAIHHFNTFDLELIHPLEGADHYLDHLRLKGEGLYHIAFAVDDIAKSIDPFLKQGIKIISSGTHWKSCKFVYLDTEKILGYVTELAERPRQADRPKPDEIFPKK